MDGRPVLFSLPPGISNLERGCALGEQTSSTEHRNFKFSGILGNRSNWVVLSVNSSRAISLHLFFKSKIHGNSDIYFYCQASMRCERF